MGRGACTPPPSRKIMVVADPTRESASALQYALSHAVLEHDELLLIHVENLNSWKNTFSNFLKLSSSSSSSSQTSSMIASSPSNDLAQGEVHFIEQMKRICELAQPKLRVRTECMGMESTKADTVLHLGEKLGVDVIIIGQRRSLSSSILGPKRGSQRGAKSIDTAEYLIENSKCICVGVQRKGQNKGYLLNTKTQKNFWLLA